MSEGLEKLLMCRRKKMKNALNVLILLLMGVMLIAGASALDGATAFVQLYTPGNNVTITSVSQEFMYSIQAPEDGKVCSLLVNGNVIRSFPNIERRKTGKFVGNLTNGEYTWKIQCSLMDGSTAGSETRTLTVNAREGSCVEKIFKGQGAYRYAFTQGCVEKAQVIIPEARVNDWLEYKFGDTRERIPGGFEAKDSYMTIYINKLAKNNGIDYMQMYSSIDPVKVSVNVGESALMDAGEQKLNITFNKVENKRAKLTIVLQGYNYATNAVQETPVVTEPETPVTPPVVTPDTEPPVTGPTDGTEIPIETGTAEETEEEGIGIIPVDAGQEELEKDDPMKFWVTIGIIVILLVIVGYLFLSKPKKEKGEHKQKEEKTEHKAEQKEEHRKQKKQKEESRKEEREEKKDNKKEDKKDEKKRDDSHFIIETGDGVKKKR